MSTKIQSNITKQKLADTLKQEMQRKDFNKITVSSIVNKCGFNRKTFYYHFEDLRDLLKWMLESEANRVLPEFEVDKDYEKALKIVVEYIRLNKKFINNIYEAIGREGLKKMLRSQLESISNKILVEEEKRQKVKLSPEHEDFIIVFYTEALGGMLIDLFKNKHGDFSEEIITYATNVVSVSLLNIIKAEKNNKI